MSRQNRDENSGVLFRNDNKKTDKHPDYTGRATIDGVEYFISGWVKESTKDGKKFFSLAYRRVDSDRRDDRSRDRDRYDDRRDSDRRNDDRGDSRRDDREAPRRSYDKDVPF